VQKLNGLIKDVIETYSMEIGIIGVPVLFVHLKIIKNYATLLVNLYNLNICIDKYIKNKNYVTNKRNDTYECKSKKQFI